jgi:sigma-B regulation protein RsbU (phosphoserine phosphatase)
MEEKDKIQSLERQVDKLTKLQHINRIINSTLDIKKLLTLIMEIIKDIMDTDASTLLLYDEKSKDLIFNVALGEAGHELTEKYRIKPGQGIAGWVAENRKPVYINEVYKDSRFDPNFDKATGYMTRALLCVPLLFKGKLIGVIQAVNPVRKDGFDDEDMDLFCSFAEQVVLAVQNAIFFKNALDEQRIKNELASAQSFHSSLLTAINHSAGYIDLSAQSIPARDVGGEFYDIFRFDGNSLGIALGDIHHKGIPGALYASLIIGALKALSKIMGENPASLVKNLNVLVHENLQNITTVSIFYGLLSIINKSLIFVKAGIVYPILVRNGVARYLKFGERSLGEEGLSLKKIKVDLEKNDLFVIITDGIVNLKNKRSQALGLKKIMDYLSGNTFENSEKVIDSLTQLANDYTEGLEKQEDISIIAFKIKQ